MTKINNKSMVYGLVIKAIFALVVISMPTPVFADTPGRVTPYNPPSMNTRNTYDYYVEPEIRYITPPPVYRYLPPEQINVNTVNRTTSTTEVNEINENTTGEITENEENSLVARAIFGETGFMPSGIIQWIFFAILILIIVILTRRMFGADKRYEAQPLKHA